MASIVSDDVFLGMNGPIKAGGTFSPAAHLPLLRHHPSSAKRNVGDGRLEFRKGKYGFGGDMAGPGAKTNYCLLPSFLAIYSIHPMVQFPHRHLFPFPPLILIRPIPQFLGFIPLGNFYRNAKSVA
jgi:hypothetical protein